MKRIHVRIDRIIPLESLKKGYFPAGTSVYTTLDSEHLEFVPVDGSLLVLRVKEEQVR